MIYASHCQIKTEKKTKYAIKKYATKLDATKKHTTKKGVMKGDATHRRYNAENML